ncbi:MAG: right-handed parallel beta-helix repeat-containing protein [Candidatus Cybelea sp.]
MTFEDLHFIYPTFDDVETYTAIHFVPPNAENVRVVRCAFVNCPVAVEIENCLQGSIMQCTFQYTSGGNVGVAVILGNTSGDAAKQIYVAGCLFFADAGPPGSTAMIIYGAEHIKVADCRMDSFLYGIRIIPGPGHNAVRCTFTSIAIFANTTDYNVVGTAVQIQPQDDDTQIAQIVFTGCSFELSETATPASPGGPGIIVDANGSIVDNVRFVSCYSTRWPGPGLVIEGGASNVEVLGGFYAGNNYETATDEAYGIYIGYATGVRIVGASCIGEYQWVTIGGVTTTYQQAVGIYVDQGAQDVLIDGCDVTGNSTDGIVVDASEGSVTAIYIRNCNVTGYSAYGTAIAVSGPEASLTTVQITNCAGYNDQSALLASSAPGNGTPFYNRTYSYYGPATFYVGAGTATISYINVGGHNTQLKTGAFALAPGQSGTVAWSLMGTPTFVMIGE